MLFDIDNSCILANDQMPISDFEDKDELFASLMNNESFKNNIYNKLLELSSLFNPDDINDYLENYRLSFSKPAINQGNRFINSGDEKLSYFNTEIDEIKEFFYNRQIYVRETIGPLITNTI